jgi:hypothetical protein
MLVEGLTYGLVAFVPTFIAEGFLVNECEVSVPREESSRVVNGHGLVDVGCDEIIILVQRGDQLS